MSKGGREVQGPGWPRDRVTWNLNLLALLIALFIALICFFQSTNFTFSHYFSPYDGELFIVSHLIASTSGEKTGISLSNSFWKILGSDSLP